MNILPKVNLRVLPGEKKSVTKSQTDSQINIIESETEELPTYLINDIKSQLKSSLKDRKKANRQPKDQSPESNRKMKTKTINNLSLSEFDMIPNSYADEPDFDEIDESRTKKKSKFDESTNELLQFVGYSSDIGNIFIYYY